MSDQPEHLTFLRRLDSQMDSHKLNLDDSEIDEKHPPWPLSHRSAVGLTAGGVTWTRIPRSHWPHTLRAPALRICPPPPWQRQSATSSIRSAAFWAAAERRGSTRCLRWRITG